MPDLFSHLSDKAGVSAQVAAYDKSCFDKAAIAVGGQQSLDALLDFATSLPKHVKDDLQARLNHADGYKSAVRDLVALRDGQPTHYLATGATSHAEASELLHAAMKGDPSAIARLTNTDAKLLTPPRR